ncbi:MAG: hypothetical protein CMJ46_00525 [Planctomyces sp.]|nr:hypothetical protein [Planctomyces sp.]
MNSIFMTSPCLLGIVLFVGLICTNLRVEYLLHRAGAALAVYSSRNRFGGTFTAIQFLKLAIGLNVFIALVDILLTGSILGPDWPEFFVGRNLFLALVYLFSIAFQRYAKHIYLTPRGIIYFSDTYFPRLIRWENIEDYSPSILDEKVLAITTSDPNTYLIPLEAGDVEAALKVIESQVALVQPNGTRPH